jgi:molybdate transport system substrate-binding protein
MVPHAALRALALVVAIALAAGGCEEKRPAPAPPAASAAHPDAKAVRLTVLAASSLADAFREIGDLYTQSAPARQIEFAFAGSNQLRLQLEHGAPGDVFVSADRKQMDAAAAAKTIDPATIRVLVRNRLAIVVPRENPARIQTLADLRRERLKIVVADKSVPVGNYTRLMLEKAAAATDFGPSFVAAFDANTVSREENVAAVIAKVALGEADAGIAYASDAAGANAAKLHVLPIPDPLDQRAEYVVAITSRAADPAAARDFLDFLRTRPAAQLLQKRGFLVPESIAP